MPLQKDSWRHLVAKEEFRLIGEPLSEQHLISIKEGTDALLKICGVDAVFDLWVSGDYSAASLEISQSTSAQRGIEPGQDLWEIATKVLGAHRIEYGRGDPTSSEAEREALPESYVMKNGQLMGSPLSFPILCAINFVAYKTALRRYIKAKGEMVAPPSKASAVAAYWKAQAEAGMATSSHGPVVPHGAPLTGTKRRGWLFQMTFCSKPS